MFASLGCMRQEPPLSKPAPASAAPFSSVPHHGPNVLGRSPPWNLAARADDIARSGLAVALFDCRTHARSGTVSQDAYRIQIAKEHLVLAHRRACFGQRRQEVEIHDLRAVASHF